MEIPNNINSIPITYNKQGSTFINGSLPQNKPSWCKEFYTAKEFNEKVNTEIQNNASKKMTIEQQEMLRKMLSKNLIANAQQRMFKLSEE